MKRTSSSDADYFELRQLAGEVQIELKMPSEGILSRPESTRRICANDSHMRAGV